MSTNELPPRPWVMECGHTTTGVQNLPDGSKRPACVICVRSGKDGDPAVTMREVMPDLEGRRMRCSYGMRHNGVCQPNRHMAVARQSERDSDLRASFFEYRPDDEFDRYYCGCWGYD